jgi:hypothetical protein
MEIFYDVTNLVARIIKNTVLIQSIVGEGLEGSIRLINIIFFVKLVADFSVLQSLEMYILID